jgi:hypothetical protein
MGHEISTSAFMSNVLFLEKLKIILIREHFSICHLSTRNRRFGFDMEFGQSVSEHIFVVLRKCLRLFAKLVYRNLGSKLRETFSGITFCITQLHANNFINIMTVYHEILTL